MHPLTDAPWDFGGRGGTPLRVTFDRELTQMTPGDGAHIPFDFPQYATVGAIWALSCALGCVCLHKHGALVRLAQSAAEDDVASARAQALVYSMVAALSIRIDSDISAGS